MSDKIMIEILEDLIEKVNWLYNRAKDHDRQLKEFTDKMERVIEK